VVTSIGIDHAGGWVIQLVESWHLPLAGKPALCGDLEPPQPSLDHVALLDAPHSRGRDYDLSVHTQSWSWFGLDHRGEVLHLAQLPLICPWRGPGLASVCRDAAQQPELIHEARSKHG
jgi:dihydrofolate synthase/folylpolyglutamate synthase